ncbi:SGNH/GDSL hydrolase family protein [Terrabacter sp. NPDC000476]|uniref:SGNH/GDSL hydrolase family protein n=1 Tax=Terrabacter sp. NPDC000476 TaxID=3154258 RepID=UPI0033292D1B
MRRFKGTDLSLGLLAVAVNVLLVTGVVMLTAGRSDTLPEPTPTPTRATSTTTAPPTVAAPTRVVASMPLTRLATATRPVTLAVLGDGTGDEEGEWVTALGTLLGRDHQVVLHNLDTSDPTRYADQLTYGKKGSTFTIWNGSRRSAPADYAVKRLSFLVPQRPDAVLLSYGRDDSADNIASHLATTYKAISTRWPGVPVATVLQAPERDDVSGVVREAARAWAKTQGVATIDVAAALRKAGDPNQFVSVVDPPSVNQRGGELWGLAVYRALGGTAPDPVAPAPAVSSTTPAAPLPSYTPVPTRPRPPYTPPPVDPTTEPEPTPTPTDPGTGTPEPSTTDPATPTPDPTPTPTEPSTPPPSDAGGTGDQGADGQ